MCTKYIRFTIQINTQLCNRKAFLFSYRHKHKNGKIMKHPIRYISTITKVFVFVYVYYNYK